MAIAKVLHADIVCGAAEETTLLDALERSGLVQVVDAQPNLPAALAEMEVGAGVDLSACDGVLEASAAKEQLLAVLEPWEALDMPLQSLAGTTFSRLLAVRIPRRPVPAVASRREAGRAGEMEEKIRAFRDQIMGALGVLQNELHGTKTDWEQNKGVFQNEGYVYREDLVVFEVELAAVERTRRMLEDMDIGGFSEISDYRARVIEALERASASSVLLRSGIALIIKLIHGMSDDAAVRPFCT